METLGPQQFSAASLGRPDRIYPSVTDRSTIRQWLRGCDIKPTDGSAVDPTRSIEKIADFCASTSKFAQLRRILVGCHETMPMFYLVLLTTRKPPTMDEAISGADPERMQLLDLQFKLAQGVDLPVYSKSAPFSLVNTYGDADFLQRLTPKETRYLGALEPTPRHLL